MIATFLLLPNQDHVKLFYITLYFNNVTQIRLQIQRTNCMAHWCVQSEEFEDTKGAIRIRISKKNRQHNGQKKKYKRTNNDQQNIHINLKIE